MSTYNIQQHHEYESASQASSQSSNKSGPTKSNMG
ncbi:hypothetical protein M8C21_026759 [Ambrosia artemisiifolia]|uniref:Uncharacterized protein n=1 Tax=Ambrosia artemisiifolia TaxID=4212 RepID=A0AAD5D853_AMBAR|nr:hypothetical protein M8C21_026759 [Ambrosia artemisiifolia]